jgi:hypothetical protein
VKTTTKQTKNRLRPIFNHEQEDTTYLCAGLAELGWTTKAIASETGLTEGQVTYRLMLIGVQRKAYRNGESNIAVKVVKMVLPFALNEAETKSEKVKNIKTTRN